MSIERGEGTICPVCGEPEKRGSHLGCEILERSESASPKIKERVMKLLEFFGGATPNLVGESHDGIKQDLDSIIKGLKEGFFVQPGDEDIYNGNYKDWTVDELTTFYRILFNEEPK